MIKKTKAEEAEIVIEKAPEAVSIEMSPEQRDKFVEFMKGEKEKEETPVVEPEKMVNIRLSTAHFLNGKKIGPGIAEVGESMVGLLQHQENQWREHELAIFAPSRTYLNRILEGGQVVPASVANAPRSVQGQFK